MSSSYWTRRKLKLVCAMNQFLQYLLLRLLKAVEQGLKLLLELPPSRINNTQRLEVLTSAFKIIMISKLNDSEQDFVEVK